MSDYWVIDINLELHRAFSEFGVMREVIVDRFVEGARELRDGAPFEVEHVAESGHTPADRTGVKVDPRLSGVTLVRAGPRHSDP